MADTIGGYYVDSTRRAIVKVAIEAASEFLSIIEDAGLTLLGSLESDWRSRTLLFVVEGDQLPQECEPDGKMAKMVKMTFTTETYGKQRINRLASVDIDIGEIYDGSASDDVQAPYDQDTPATWERYSETKDDGGKIVLVRYPEGYRLRFNGETVWKEGEPFRQHTVTVAIDGADARKVIADVVEQIRQNPYQRDGA